MLKVDQEQLNKVFQKHQVKLAYLFGSQAKGETGPLSDIDIAVQFTDNQKINTFKRKIQLMADLSSIFKSDKVDVVNLDQASLILFFRIVQKGRVLYCEDEIERMRQELKITSRYRDRKFYLDRHTNLSMRSFAEGGLGLHL